MLDDPGVYSQFSSRSLVIRLVWNSALIAEWFAWRPQDLFVWSAGIDQKVLDVSNIKSTMIFLSCRKGSILLKTIQKVTCLHCSLWSFFWVRFWGMAVPWYRAWYLLSISRVLYSHCTLPPYWLLCPCTHPLVKTLQEALLTMTLEFRWSANNLLYIYLICIFGCRYLDLSAYLFGLIDVHCKLLTLHGEASTLGKWSIESI